MLIHVTDPADPRLDDYRNIPDAELVQRRGLFIAEGRLVVRLLLTGCRFPPRSVMVTETAYAALTALIGPAPTVPVYIVPPQVMNGVAGVNIHRGCLAVGERPLPPPWRDVAVSARRIVAVERIGNADNIGGLFRNAAALGGDAVLLDPDSTDPLYRKAIRTSIGASLRVPFARLEPWPDGLRELRALGFVLVGMTPASTALALHDAAPGLRYGKVAVVVGHEGDGLSAAALELCDLCVRIPMTAGIDSLNVATAAAIALYELRR